MGASAGTRPGSRQALLFFSRLCCGHDSDLAYYDSCGCRFSGLGGGPMEHKGRTLDYTRGNHRGFCNHADRLGAPLPTVCAFDPRQLDRTARLEMDTAVRHSLSFGSGWSQPAAPDAYVFPWNRICTRFMGRNSGGCWFLSPQPALSPRGNHGSLPGHGSVSFLLRLGADAGSHVFPDCAVGARTKAV